ncbi:hypothetical protein ANO11243_051260 [Dothideomycetidae sp. 11243]|nr:hypothetical protein ANO11243_051260 [fungal sp. No.11243]
MSERASGWSLGRRFWLAGEKRGGQRAGQRAAGKKAGRRAWRGRQKGGGQSAERRGQSAPQPASVSRSRWIWRSLLCGSGSCGPHRGSANGELRATFGPIREARTTDNRAGDIESRIRVGDSPVQCPPPIGPRVPQRRGQPLSTTGSARQRSKRCISAVRPSVLSCCFGHRTGSGLGVD